MSLAERRRQDVESSLGGLSLSKTSHKKRQVPKQQTGTIADSWDEDASSDTETEASPRTGGNDFPSAPPPTPMTPNAHRSFGDFENPYSPNGSGDSIMSPMRGHFRPEKQTAVAGRLIAGALGVRAPKKTDEQRQYEKSIKENEMRRREKEREDKRRAEEDAQKARAAIWDS